MPTIGDITRFLDSIAPPSLQESYDNAGLLTGSDSWKCTGVLCTLDVTENIIEEAISRQANLVVAHHPVIFKGLKRLTPVGFVERTIIKAIKNDIALFAIHTNLDNVIHGVNGRIADKLSLVNRSVLSPMGSSLLKLVTFVPTAQLEQVREALFAAGAGQIGNYSECSFSVAGTGTYKAGPGTNPFAGRQGIRHAEPELRVEVILPTHLKNTVLQSLIAAHPYEEVAYDLVSLANQSGETGSGLMGELAEPLTHEAFLERVQQSFGLKAFRHTAAIQRPIHRVAVCGGAGSFLLPLARGAGADAYITADMKYHEFFEADGRLLVCDIGHYESEQFTVDLLNEVLEEKFPTFAVLKSAVRTNPVQYFLG